MNKIDVVAGCSQRECDLAVSIGAKRAELLNNYVTYESNERPKSETLSSLKLVVLGRVAPQKDPQFLLDTLSHIKQSDLTREFDITWIGGGDTELEDQLRSHGITVTGMIPRNEVVSLLKN